MKIAIQSGHFWIEFDNGYTLSVFNGYGSHTDNYDKINEFMKIIEKRNIYSIWKSQNVEIGILKAGTLVTDKILHYDDIVKTVDLKELIAIINLLNNLEE